MDWVPTPANPLSSQAGANFLLQRTKKVLIF
jgi:hypothetical protein